MAARQPGGVRRSVRSVRLVASIALVAGGVAASSELGRSVGQISDAGATDESLACAERGPICIDGRVVDARGKAVGGAVVFADAGGKAVSRDDGSSRLELPPPASAASLRVTAVAGSGAASLVGSALLVADSSGSPTRAGDIVMELGGCDPSWIPTFGRFEGFLDNSVRVTCTFDHGTGPELYVAGDFLNAGSTPVQRIARFDPVEGFQALGSGVDGRVEALAVHDDGSGPLLYVGGSFDFAGGAPSQGIATWDGTSWSSIGGVNGTVDALEVFDDGGGPALFAVGAFTLAGGVPSNNIAKWNGTAWEPLGAGLDDNAYSLAVWDDGGGPALFVGGNFEAAGGAPANSIARWDGAAWSALGSGVEGGSPVDSVFALEPYADGSPSGSRLYAAGDFLVAGGVPAERIAAWDGSAWSDVGGIQHVGPYTTKVYALGVHDDGSGPLLYVGGRFSSAGGVPVESLARWDGASWSSLDDGMDGAVNVLAGFDDRSGGGVALYAGGEFELAHDSRDRFLARRGVLPPCGLPGSAYCFGDGSGAACPCGNAGAPGAGCANSSGNGAVLVAHGSAAVANDTLRLAGSRLLAGEPALLFQGVTAVHGGLGVEFGDGLRCAGGSVIRIQVLVPDSLGTTAYPRPGDPALSIEGAVQPGDTRRYQLWYRDPSNGPCGSGFNLSNGYEVAWQ